MVRRAGREDGCESGRSGRRSGGGGQGEGTDRGRGYPEEAGVRETDGMVLFWKPPSCFVQWTLCNFKIEGVKYSSAEQWMMASKANLFDDRAAREKIMETMDPREQKALGRTVRGFDAAKWERHGYDVVVEGNYAKFSQNPDFLQRLLDTGDKILAEASPYDTEWGIGLHASDDNALVQRRWQGKNKLGEALMEVRTRLREEGY